MGADERYRHTQKKESLTTSRSSGGVTGYAESKHLLLFLFRREMLKAANANASKVAENSWCVLL